LSDLPLVTVLIPARNEASDIEGCLATIAAQDYPRSRLEVLVVDGASTDGTASIARRTLARWGFRSGAVLTNDRATTPSNLNLGLARATGEVVCRVDARTRIEPHHVSTCVATLRARSDVAVVGGAQVAVARDRSARALGIARALNNRCSMGWSPYQSRTTSGPSDTVYLGAFRAPQLRALHGWDERLPTNQDYDLNRRMAALGTVWFEAGLRSGYVPRATFGELWSQYERFGRWKVRYWRITGDRPARRQLLALVGPPIAGLALALGVRADARAALAPVALLAAVDARGASADEGGPLSRGAAITAICLVAGGWSVGVWRELLSGRRRDAVVRATART